MTLKSPLDIPFFARLLVIVAAGMLPSLALSGEVVLKATDGSANLVGELIDFSDDNYVIQTSLGEFRISTSQVSCEGESCPKFDTGVADVVIAGSDTIGTGMMPLLLSGYASYLDTEWSVETTEQEGEILASLAGDAGDSDELGSFLVTPTTSGEAFSSLLEKTAQIGMASRRIQNEESTRLQADGAGNMTSPLQEHVVAVDSLVVIVHPENELDSITMAQLRGIYSGKIKNWSELGGVSAPIKVIDRQLTSGSRNVFMTALFGAAGETTDPIGVVAENNNDVTAMVTSDPTAIGYAGYAFQRGASPLALINDCGIHTTADAFSAKTEEYPLQRRLYLYNRGDNLNDASSDFINYATSSSADEVIAKSGFINLGVKVQDMDLMGPRGMQLLDPDVVGYNEGGVMREMLSKMLEFDRLSTTFRFAIGASGIGARGLVDMSRLLTYLSSQPAGTTVLFAGFTDSVGGFEHNLFLSEKRAAFAAQRFIDYASKQIGEIEFTAAGFGEIAPVACNNNPFGRSINRRVEVWIKPPAKG